MTKPLFRPAAAAAVAACFSFVASPVLAAPSVRALPHSAVLGSLPGDVAHDRGGWGRHHGGGGDDAGDIFAGLLFIGAIAAVASAASNANKTKVVEHHYDVPPPPPPPANYGDWGRSRSIDGAVDTCVGEVERSLARRVDTVDGVTRDGDGWRIGGRTRSGDPFQCAIDGDGRVRSVTVNGRAPMRD